LFALTLAAGMESDALSILEKKHLEGLKRMKEAHEYAKRLLAQHPDATDARHCTRHRKLHCWVAEPWFPLCALVRWNPRRQEAWHGASRQAAENGCYLLPFAKIVLALAARPENQTALAPRLLRELKEQYPKSTLFASEYAKAISMPSGD
jgi:hypothetical protein